jgi:DNA (cytosine-5)-methyltransferase 1
LFTGIGGIDIGLEWAGFETAWQVDNSDFCQKILQKRWPDVPKFLDVRDVGKHNLTPVTIISGGFPCQDLSIAAGGKKRGLFERSGLWFEYARIIRELRPAWVLVENVPHLKNHGADIVLADLEEANYAATATLVGSNSFQAPFKRQRVYILAHNNDYPSKRIGEDVVNGWTLHPDTQRKVEETGENWNRWKHELDTRDASSPGDPEESETTTYARGRRELYGIPSWSHRLNALGNACVPVVPALIGEFIKNYENA